MKILIAPDKFKGSLTAQEVCDAIEKGILNILPKTEVIKLPLADGGEGSLEVLESEIKFKRKYLTVNNPIFSPISTWYGFNGDAAYIELAKASGLQLLDEEEKNPNFTTSLGTGELLIDAIQNGAKKIFLFIGGSATNDAAMGIASALGYKFYDSEKNELKPVGENLIVVKHVEYLPKVSLQNVEINVYTDVLNPFFGENGAAYIYSGQKGANKNSIIKLDNGLKNIAKIFANTFNMNISEIPGSGAAGGIGGGMLAFCNSKLKSGVKEIFKFTNFCAIAKSCDIIITGEGKLDSQTSEGKVVKGVIDYCEENSKLLGIVCGDTTLSNKERVNFNMETIKKSNISTKDSMRNANRYLIERSEALIRKLIK